MSSTVRIDASAAAIANRHSTSASFSSWDAIALSSRVTRKSSVPPDRVSFRPGDADDAHRLLVRQLSVIHHDPFHRAGFVVGHRAVRTGGPRQRVGEAGEKPGPRRFDAIERLGDRRDAIRRAPGGDSEPEPGENRHPFECICSRKKGPESGCSPARWFRVPFRVIGIRVPPWIPPNPCP